MSRPLAVICLAAGLGKRTKLSLPKVLLPLCGRSLAATSLFETAPLKPTRVIVVVHHAKDRVQKALTEAMAGVFDDLQFVDQGDPRGTGHAVSVAMQSLADFDGDVLVTYGDCPLVTAETLEELRTLRSSPESDSKGSAEGSPCSVLTGYPDDPSGYGRILRNEEGGFAGIREDRDCSEEEHQIDEINAGFYCFDAKALRRALDAIQSGDAAQNAQGELYLTDAVMWLARDAAVPTLEVEDATDIQGVNTLVDLAIARNVMQERILIGHLQNGVLITDPVTTWIDHDVEIGADTTIFPSTVIGSGCRIGSHCEVGPFSHLRVGTVLEDGAAVGNFVEAKKTRLGAGAKAKHLTYLGDAEIGAKSNIGAGTITANYDGVHKHQTVIGAGCFVGSGTVIVAPSRLADGAMTGAGAIVVRDTEIGENEVWVGVPAKKLKVREVPAAKGAKTK